MEMEKVFAAMPGNNNQVKANKILEINVSHPIWQKLKDTFAADKDKVKDIANVLYASALLIEGMPVDNATEFADTVCKLLS
jgi:molecular chaperone HtpG